MSFRVVHGLENYTRLSDRPGVVTVGTFDGIHVGHQEILRRVQCAGEAQAHEPILITFHPHPRLVVTPDSAPSLLTTIEEKERFLADYFQGTVLVLEFNRALMELSARQFVEDVLLGRLGMSKLIVGYDHAFGKDRSGSIIELNRMGDELGYNVEVVGPVLVDGERVSSTIIRHKLETGDFSGAVTDLGHPYGICGPIEKGIGLGHKLGYPTANVAYNPRKLLPPEGVYACRAEVLGQRHDGMMFIGRNHFNPEKRITVEANLFDFDDDIYGQDMIVCPTRFLRPNQRFDSTDDLVAQIKTDKKQILQIFQQEKSQCP